MGRWLEGACYARRTKLRLRPRRTLQLVGRPEDALVSRYVGYARCVSRYVGYVRLVMTDRFGRWLL